MRITVDIPEDTLKSLMDLTGEKDKSPAVAKAAELLLKRTKAREFGRLLREGAFNYPANEIGASFVCVRQAF